MNHAVRKIFVALSLAGAGLATTGTAHAGGVSWHIGINLPGVFYPAPPVVVYEPRVVYEPPPRVVYAPPPVIYRPAPIVYEPVPVYAQRAPRGYWRDGRWCDDRDDRGRHGGWDHRDRDDDRHGDRRYGY